MPTNAETQRTCWMEGVMSRAQSTPRALGCFGEFRRRSGGHANGSFARRNDRSFALRARDSWICEYSRWIWMHGSKIEIFRRRRNFDAVRLGELQASRKR